MKRALGFVGYWVYILFIENLDQDLSMLRTDDYHGRYRREWWDFSRKRFTRGS